MIIVSQAGGVVFRRGGGALEFLLVSAKSAPSTSVFPKGHIEAGESARDAARREVAEEAGVVGEVVAPLGAVRFSQGGTILHVEFFLMEYTRDVPPVDRRRIDWLSYEEAWSRLTHQEARDLLGSAWTFLSPGVPPPEAAPGR